MTILSLIILIISAILLIVTAIRKRWGYFFGLALVFLASLFVFFRSYQPNADVASQSQQGKLDMENIGHVDESEPFDYLPVEVPDDVAFITVNENQAIFSDSEMATTETFTKFSDLDNLDRVGQMNAVINQDSLPSENAEPEEADHDPTGFQEAAYDRIPGNQLYYKDELLDFRLGGQETEPKNLLTVTEEVMNTGIDVMVTEIENFLAENDQSVRVRVTPAFNEDDLLASGIYFEAKSIEDDGAGLNFFVYLPNRQYGIEIDYSDGSNQEIASQEYEENIERETTISSESLEESISQEESQVEEETFQADPETNTNENLESSGGSGSPSSSSGSSNWAPARQQQRSSQQQSQQSQPSGQSRNQWGSSNQQRWQSQPASPPRTREEPSQSPAPVSPSTPEPDQPAPEPEPSPQEPAGDSGSEGYDSNGEASESPEPVTGQY